MTWCLVKYVNNFSFTELSQQTFKMDSSQNNALHVLERK